jgi:Protein of unknown function (DUF1592)/Protein of unknown function (DUF1588)/Protein of unknown function (DUF1587)/Protein of unknown function (DUF1585)/Protein of unknown function (DUF1595)/Ca-dependent carbohydrate-binding module xylan-binding/Planctomycete cytochrome C
MLQPGIDVPHDVSSESSVTATPNLRSQRSLSLSQPAQNVTLSRAGESVNGIDSAELTSARTAAESRRAILDQTFLKEQLVPFLAEHCIDCHGADEQMAGIALHELQATDDFLRQRHTWERVYRMLNAGAMPPQDYDPLPTDEERHVVAEFLYDQLYNFDCDLVDHPGRPTIQRLNRAEYNNTIRDLFGINIRPADQFPADDVGEGFDNIGDVLSLPPLLLEKYLDAAERVANAVIDTRDVSSPRTMRFEGKSLVSSLERDSGLNGFKVLYTNGTMTADVKVPEDGRYRIRIEAAADQAGDDKARMAISVDSRHVQEYRIQEHRKPQWYEHELQLKAGTRHVSAVFLNDFYDANAPGPRKDRNLGVRTIEVIGPEGGLKSPDWHPVHRRFVVQRPDDHTNVQTAAQAVLRPIMYRAFRRPVTDTEVIRYAKLVRSQVDEFGDTYEQGLSVALQAVLIAPEFLFRLEPAPTGSADRRKLNSYEVASRLSYFLWSSMPDDDLLALAENKRLLDHKVLRQQVARMLRDDKAQALAENFAAQWLNLRNLSEVTPNPDVFPDFDRDLKQAMARETELLFNTIVREDRNVDEFLTADYTFVNERLAKHYGIRGVTGDDFVRVGLDGTNRSGVLTHASILTLTSNPGRTSPVKRGKWILQNILNDAPPPPPPSVPPLEDTAEQTPGLSLTEQLALHREDPGCASCHKMMDPLGLGLENFDAIGRWRDRDGEHDIDSAGILPNGDAFSGPLELIHVLRSRKEKFHRALAERMLTYALGRGLEYYDKCAIDETLTLMQQRGNRFSALVEGIVSSDCFLSLGQEREPRLARQP